MLDMQKVKELRERTGLGLDLVVKAMTAASNDTDAALEWLRRNVPKAKIEDPTDPAAEGRIATYIHHNGNLGAMVHLACKTDFTARNEEFVRLASDIAMHVAAANPRWIAVDLIDPVAHAEELARVQERTAAEGIPEARRKHVNDGRMRAFYCEKVLLEQPFTKDPKVTVGQLCQALSAKVGEPITVKNMARFEVGR